MYVRLGPINKTLRNGLMPNKDDKPSYGPFFDRVHWRRTRMQSAYECKYIAARYAV